MTLRIRDFENREMGKEECREEGIKIGEEKGIFRSLDNFLRKKPCVDVDAGADMLGFDTKKLDEYKRTRGVPRFIDSPLVPVKA